VQLIDLIPLDRLGELSPEQQQELLTLAEKLAEARQIERARMSFMAYAKYLWPRFIEGRHHRIMADAFDRIIDGSLRRLIICMAPRHTKSKFTSELLTSKYIGHYPDRYIIQTSHGAELAQDFGRDTRNLVDSPEYQKIFPGTTLKADTKAAGRWNTTEGGKYYAIGVGGHIAGKGADLLVIDDAHSEQDYIRSLGGDTSSFDDAFQWYQTGPRQRLQPKAAIVICCTRWHMSDIVGQLKKRMKKGGEKWEIIEFPAFDPPDSEIPLWPEFWSAEELIATRDTLSPQQWAAQYLQNPISETSAIIKRDWWQVWNSDEPPECEFVIQSWDTAFSQKTSANYSACTDWGVFYSTTDDGQKRANVILLDAFRERMEFPDLKREAIRRYKKRKPDCFIVEAKATGPPLIYELRAMGIPVTEFTPVRGSKAAPNDKVARVNSISDLFRSGIVWRPDRRWAEDVAEEFAAFPSGETDDFVDSGTQALMRFRQGGFLPMDTDMKDEVMKNTRKADYY
jgi:predicted phage terminase large subunit-like protein